MLSESAISFLIRAMILESIILVSNSNNPQFLSASLMLICLPKYKNSTLPAAGKCELLLPTPIEIPGSESTIFL